MRREEESRSSEMKCPKCGRYSLKRRAEKVLCRFCGHELSVGEEARFRLYELLKDQDTSGPMTKDGRRYS
jgi:ribosomal protein L37AE/L43A